MVLRVLYLLALDLIGTQVLKIQSMKQATIGLHFFILGSLFAAAIFGPTALLGEAAAIDIVAKVGDEIITLDDLRRAERKLRRYEADQDKRELLQPFIDRQLLRIEAEQAGLATAPKVLQTLDKIRRRQLAEKVYAEEVTRKVVISDAEIRQYFVENSLDQKHEVRASHILLSTGEEAQAVEQRLAAGEDFAALAEELSQDNATASKGGDVGFWQQEDARKSPYVKHFIALDVGEVSTPYRNNRGGHHLIKVTEHRLLGFERQRAQIKRILERQKKKERWAAYLAEERERYQLAVVDETLEFLLDEGRLAVDKIPPIDPVDHPKVIARYKGGEVDLGAYLQLVQEATDNNRPRAVDSTAVVQFIEREVMRNIVLTFVAEAQGWHLAEDVVSYLKEKKEQAMVEMLRRVKVEEPILTAAIRQDYYQSHQPDFLQSDRVFFEGGLLESAQKAAEVIERVRQGEKLAIIMKDYPAFSDQWRKYDVFDFSSADIASHGIRWAKAVNTVKSLQLGEVGGPVELHFEGYTKGYLVVKALAVVEPRVLPYDDPFVQDTVWRKTRFELRDEINRAFYSYLQELRQQYGPTVVVYDDILMTLGEEAQ